jgi:uncharacterized membrane protein
MEGLISCRATLIALTLVCFGADEVVIAAPSFQGLGELSGNPFGTSEAYAVSADGTTVVGRASAPEGGVAFRWTAAGGMQSLGQVSGFTTTGYGVSADGSVVVGATNGTSTPPFRWTSATGMEIVAGVTSGFAWGVSGAGSTIAGYTWVDGSQRAYRWTQAGGATLLADAPGGSVVSNGLAISSDGSLVVGSASSAVAGAARWTADGNVTVLPAPPTMGQVRALAVSGDNTTIVGTLRTNDYREAFRWTAQTGIELLDVPESGAMGTGYGVSGDGSVIVGSGFGGAMIWDAALGPRDLKAVLQGELGLDLSNWTLTEARGVSADGRTIVGLGRNPAGLSEGWIARLPEPAGLAMALPAVTLLTRRRRCRRDVAAG